MPRAYRVLLVLFLLAALTYCAASLAPGERRISLADLQDKIEGGWAGQMIGVSYGYPTEFYFTEGIIPEDKLPQWTDETIANALDQDDLYVDMTFAQVLDDNGLDATTEDFGAMFQNAAYRLWHANLAARRALKRGVPANLAGTPEYNAHANDIDFQIESDFVGLMAPGLPQAANDLCLRAGRVMNHGDGIYGGMFVSGMYAAAYFESDPRKIVEAGLACMPPDSPYAQVIRDVLDWSAQQPDDWMEVWRKIDEKWNKREPCPNGALRPFNIDAKLNGAYIALGLLYGAGDFDKTLLVSTRAGQDSDCNPSNACGILGVMHGYKAIPEKWKRGIPAIADQKFNFTDFTFRTIVESTQKRAVALAERNGGRLDGESLIVKTQQPQPPPLEVWEDYGSPAERIAVEDARWKWKGAWQQQTIADRRQTQWVGRLSSKKGSEASITFEGTGAILTGPYLPTGGKAEVHLDGKLHKTVDTYPDEDNRKYGEAVWHAFGLDNGSHTIRVVVLGEPYAGSQGSDIEIEDLIVFR
jgi:ADP-ribosylglycohydrolase